MRLLTALFSLLMLAGPAFADHAADNAAEVSRVAFRSADDAEALSDEALRDPSGPVYDLRLLSQAAGRLHFAFSDLYRTARWADTAGGSPVLRGNRIRDDYRICEQPFQELRDAWYRIEPQASPEVRRLYEALQYAEKRLEWLVLARRDD